MTKILGINYFVFKVFTSFEKKIDTQNWLGIFGAINFLFLHQLPIGYFSIIFPMILIYLGLLNSFQKRLSTGCLPYSNFLLIVRLSCLVFRCCRNNSDFRLFAILMNYPVISESLWENGLDILLGGLGGSNSIITLLLLF